MGWRMRPYVPAADREWVKGLWAAALPPSWPPLPAGIAMLRDGLVAEAGADPVGLAAVDVAGSIPLILVHPAHQRRGIGTGLLTAALDKLRAAGAIEVTAASGGDGYIWPGVPHDLAAGVRFFASRGWSRSQDTLDLVADLAGYHPPAAAGRRAARAGISLATAASADAASVLEFETANFPSWVRWFGAGHRGVLIARDGSGNIAGTLLFEGPGADTVLAPMLGTALVTRASQLLGQAGTRICHIGWTVRESFYRGAGYQPWRRYAMFSHPA